MLTVQHSKLQKYANLQLYLKLHRIQETSFNTSKLSERPKDS